MGGAVTTDLVGLTPYEATIASGEAESDLVALGQLHPAAIVMPPAWTAAPLSFLIDDGVGDFLPLYGPDGAEVTIAPEPGRRYTLDPDLFYSVARLKVRSGTDGAPVPQTAERRFLVQTRVY